MSGEEEKKGSSGVGALVARGASNTPNSRGGQRVSLGLEECVETLISVNNDLNLPDAAAGILEFSGVPHEPMLLEKLDRWSEALARYDSDRGHVSLATQKSCLKATRLA